MSIYRFMLLCVMVLGPAMLARADAPAATKNHSARNFVQACAPSEKSRLEKSYTSAAFDQQMLSLAAPGPLPSDSELLRAMCKVALWRLETSAGAYSAPLSSPAEPSTIQSAAGTFEARLNKLEDELRQGRDNPRTNTSAETPHKEPGKIEIVAGIAGLALFLSIVSIFYAHRTIRRVLRDAGLR
jgi:hypothetical protein